MQIAATEFKSLIKRLAPASAEMTAFTDHGLVAQGSDLTIAASSEAFKGLGLFQVNARKLSSVVSRLSGQVDVQKVEPKHCFPDFLRRPAFLVLFVAKENLQFALVAVSSM